MNQDEEMEEIIRELLSLAGRKPLSKADLSRAKRLMVKLREMGFTNSQISDLTDGGWSEATVKLYTRGVTVKDPSPKADASKLLVEMVNRGLTLNDVELSISIKVDSDAKGVSLEDISSLLEEVKRSKVSVKDLLQIYGGLKDSGLSIIQLSQWLSYRSELEDAGFTLDGLKKVYEASKNYGSYIEVLEAINTYGSHKTIEAEVKRVTSEKEKLEKQVNEMNSVVKELEEKRAPLEEALRLYEELKNLGFDEEALKQLETSSEKYGGVKRVLEAVNTYTSLAELKSKVEEHEKKRVNVESELKTVQADHAHLQTVIAMCDTLLYKYRFSVPAMKEIYEMAKKYGEPIEVIKAIGRYGELKAIETELEKLSSKRGELESRVKELNKQLEGLRALSEEVKNTARGLLEPFTADIGKNVELLMQKFSEAFDTISTKYKEYAEELGELKADAGGLEEELRLARVLQALIKYPSEGEKYPLDYDILMLRGVMNHCRVKGVNPKVAPSEPIRSKYYFAREVELLDLVDWTMRGLITSQGPSR